MITLKMAAAGLLIAHFLVFISPILCFDQQIDVISAADPEEVVPVLLWESNDGSLLKGEENTALERLESEEFENFLLRKVTSQKPTILLFAEENLSSEDFVIGDLSGVKSYKHLKELLDTTARSIFIPSVHAPLSAFKALEAKGYKWISYNGDKNKESGPVVVNVNLNDALDGESRPDMLKKHDKIITDVYSKLKNEYKNILVVYTGRYSSWTQVDVHHRVRRLLEATAATDAGNGTVVVDKDNRAMLYMVQYPVLNVSGGNPIVLKKPTMTVFNEKGDMQKLIVTFSDPQKIILRFRFNTRFPGYWSFGEVEVSLPNATELILSAPTVTVPVNFSYHCSAQDTVFSNGSTRLILKDFQLQTYLTQKKFSDGYDCVYFFTIPILSGLFITSLLAIIMAWGLCMILDIKTMDRFDDPKGKTISINLLE